MELMHLLSLTEADRTYLARINFLADTFGDEHKELPEGFEEGFDYYLGGWEPSRGGFIALGGPRPRRWSLAELGYG